MLLILLSVSLFQSLLAIEKMLIALLLCTICFNALWLLPFRHLSYRQFNLWLINYNNNNTSITDEYNNITLLEQLTHYCR